MRVYFENAQMTSQRDTNKEVPYEPQVISVTDVDVLHALLTNQSTHAQINRIYLFYAFFKLASTRDVIRASVL